MSTLDNIGIVGYLTPLPRSGRTASRSSATKRSSASSTSPTATTSTCTSASSDHARYRPATSRRRVSMTLGADGSRPYQLLARHGPDLELRVDLKVAHCNDIACTSATNTILDSADNVGSFELGDDRRRWARADQPTTDRTQRRPSRSPTATTSPCTSAFSSTLGPGGDDRTRPTVGADGLRADQLLDTPAAQRHPLPTTPCCTSASTHHARRRLQQRGSHTSVTIGTDGLGLISSLRQALTGGLQGRPLLEHVLRAALPAPLGPNASEERRPRASPPTSQSARGRLSLPNDVSRR